MTTEGVTTVFGDAISDAFAPHQTRPMSQDELRVRLDAIKARSTQRRRQATERSKAIAYGQLSEGDIVDFAIVRLKRRAADKHAAKRSR